MKGQNVAMIEAGAQLGPCQVARKLGAGGYADVWLAVEEGRFGFRKHVALKVLREMDVDSHARRELLNEARVCGLLRHPNVIQVHDIDELDGKLVVAMEYVDGLAVSELLKALRRDKLRMPRVVVLDLATEIARGLEYAHTAEGPEGPLHVVHRDLKPPNVLLSGDGAVKIADFGLAKASTNTDKTATGILKGTPRYLAPEMWETDRNYGPWTDWFSFGAVLYELETGEPMWPADVPKAAARSLFGTVERDLEGLDDRIPGLRTLLTRLLERDSHARASVVGTVLDEVRRLRRRETGAGSLEVFAAAVVGGEPLPKDVAADPDWWGLAACAHRFPLRRKADVDAEKAEETARQQRAERLAEGLPAEPSLDESADVTDADATDEEWEASGLPSGALSPPAPLAEPPSQTRRVPLEPGGSDEADESLVDDEGGAPWVWALAAAAVLAAGLLWFWLGAGPSEVPPIPATAAAASGRQAPRGTAAPGAPSPIAAAATSAPEPAPASPALAAPVPAAPAAAPAPVAAASPASTPVPVAAPAPAATPAPVAALSPASTPVPVAAPAPTATSAPIATPTPAPVAAAPSPGCLILQSRPPGADVWIAGKRSSEQALMGNSAQAAVPPGTVHVAMGFKNEQLAEVSAAIRPGLATVVRCDLMGVIGRKAETSASACAP